MLPAPGSGIVDADAREILAADIPRVRENAADDFRNELPGVQIDFDPITGGPAHIMAAGKFLAPPPVAGGDAVADFLDSRSELFGHDSRMLAPGRSRLTREDVSAHNGMKTLVWQQEIDGIPFFRTLLRANVTKTGEIITAGGNFLADPEAATGLDRSGRARLVENPPLAATRALTLAAADLGLAVDESSVAVTDGPQGIEHLQMFQAPELSDTRASLAWVPTGPASARLAWDVTLTGDRLGEMFRTLVDAETGEILVRHALTNYISNATYRVYADPVTKQPYDSPTPLSPGHPSPLAAQPSQLARQLVTVDALDPVASPAGWIADGGESTIGNNVAAHTDADESPNSPDLPRPTSITRDFDFPLSLASQPGTYGDAAVTQLFYVTNWVHDKLHGLGFTETAGNFQTDNFGRGGLGQDAVIADAQDASGTNNANFSTPPDGYPARMQMYIFTGPTPAIDGTLDTEIVIHEYAHGLSNRLVGGGAGMSASQSRGMGEGWSDFYALALLSQPGDDPQGTYAAGAYATRQYSGLTQNYYFGIRRFPYSTDLTKNPLTFKDIDPGQAATHTGIPRSPIIGNVANEVHNQGEVWCSALWQMRANLIAAHGFTDGNQLALQLVTDAMKLSPIDPNFIQARDAILTADLVTNGGVNAPVIWSAFAKRGLGASAIAPPANTTAGVVEAFDVPDDLTVTPLGSFTAEGSVGGTISPAARTFTLRNNGAADLTWAAGKSQAWLSLSASGGQLAPGAETTVTATFNAAASALTPGNYADTITFTNTTSGAQIARPASLRIEPLYQPVFSDNFESGGLAGAWTVTGTGDHRTIVTGEHFPYAGNFHLTMDSSVDSSYARNEATLTLDLAGKSDLVLNFRVKMFNDEDHAPAANPFTGGADFDGIAVSADGGSTWHEIRELRSVTNAWQKISIDLDAALAARGLSYNSAFKIRFNHYDNYRISTDGFAFDDILVATALDQSLAITAPESAVEGDGPVTATLAISPPSQQELTVSLEAGGPDATVPSTVVVPPGAGSVTFPISPFDDALLDGSQAVAITATTVSYPAASTTFTVHDNETATLALAVPSSITEGSSPLNGLVTVDAPVDREVAITLTCDSPSLQIPASVTIAPGTSSAQFSIVPLDDNRINGDRPTTVNASVIGWTGATRPTTILDDESSVLTLELPAMREGDIGKSGVARISGTLDVPLVVSLTATPPSEWTVPATVTIPAGETSVGFAVEIIDDTETDGGQETLLTASAAGFPAAQASGWIADNDVHHFAVGPIDGPVLRNSPVAVVVTAKAIDGETITNFVGAVSFSAGLPVAPPASGDFNAGVLALELVFSDYATGVVLAVSDGAGHTGESEPFDVVAGAPDHFIWSDIPSPQPVDSPFPVTIRAVDIAGNQVEAFSGPADLSAILPDKVQVLSWTKYADTTVDGEYARTKQAISSHFTGYVETSTTTTDPAALAALLAGKNVFLIVEQEDSSGATLAALGTAWAPVLNNFVVAGGTVIVCSNNTSEHLILSNSGLMDAVPIASPSSAAIVKLADTPLNEGVAVPFTGAYLHTYFSSQATVDLLTTAGDAVLLSRTLGDGRVVLVGTDFYTLGTGMDRAIANAVALAAQSGDAGLPVSPGATGTFTGGEWSGTISLPFTASSLRLRASAGLLESDSNAFAVLSADLPPAGDGLAVVLPAEVTEGAGSTVASVTLATPLTDELTVALVSLSPSKISVPATVVIPAGEIFASFGFIVENDPFTDGTKTVVIFANATGFSETGASLLVLDDDGSSLALGLPATVTENAGTASGTLTLDVAPLVPLAVSLVSADPLSALPPATVLVPRGATSVAFSIAIPDDSLIEGDLAVELTASATGWSPATAEMTVTDDESRELALSFPASFRESNPPATGTVRLAGTAAADVTVTLVSDNPAEISVPASVVITAGSRSATFAMTIGDDTDADGPQTFEITATADSFIAASAGGIVLDNEADHFTFEPIASPQLAGGPVPAVVTARDAQGAVLTEYQGTVNLSAVGNSGSLAVSPASAAGFLHGVWSGSVSISAADTAVVLTAGDGLGHAGSSAPFDLVAGAIDRFEWDPLPAQVARDTPFTATLRAVDAGGATVAGYQGAVNWFVSAGLENSIIGTNGTQTMNRFLQTTTHDSRSESLYLAGEIGPAARLTALAFHVTGIGAGSETLGDFTIRLKHTVQPTLVAGSPWDNSGWTQVFRATTVISSSGWLEIPFTTPFDFNGISNLLVEVSFNRDASTASEITVQGTPAAATMMRQAGANSTNGDPLTWTGTLPYPAGFAQRADLKFSSLKELPLRPSRSGAFAGGVWTGELSVPVAGSGARLIARAGVVVGTSGALDITTVSAPSDGTTVFAEDFESGVLDPAVWKVTGTGNFRTRVTPLFSPNGGSRHLAMDSTSGAARNEVTLTLDLAGRTGVVLEFHAAGYNDEPNGPPPAPFTGGSDFDGVAISVDGSTWWEVRGLRSLPATYAKFSVDLDQIVADLGAFYHSNFKIRFNQFDDSSLTTDGIVIDDIRVRADPVSGFRITGPASVGEGDGSAFATVELFGIAAEDTTVDLSSGAPAKLTVPPSVVVPAGETAVDFPLGIIDDKIADGNRDVGISGSIGGNPAVGFVVEVVDDETLPLGLTLPPMIAEGGGALTGQVTLGAPASGTVAVDLLSDDPAVLTVPSQVVFQPGQTTAHFPLTVVNDSSINGTRTLTVTAARTGWTPVAAVVVVTDDETRALAFSGQLSGYEGSKPAVTVGISGSLPNPLVVSLVSSNPAQYSVPASVVIPPGQISASFEATVADDAATDGVQTVTVTASAVSFTAAVTTANAYDDDVHHFDFSVVPSPQKSGVAFPFTVSARDVNHSIITVYAGPAAFTAAGTGGPLEFSISGGAGFVSGIWNGSGTCPDADAAAQITATDGSASGTSNVFEILASPGISLDPESIELTLNRGETTTRELTITNNGGGTLAWSIATNPDPGPAIAATIPLQNALNNLNFNASLIPLTIPNRFPFTDGITGTTISDGGSDMYDGGNILGTNLGGPIPYSDNLVASSAALGANGKYFTRKLDGFWVMAADIGGLSHFEINGNLGADGSGFTDTAVLSSVRDGVTWRGFVKRVYGTPDPSVNHIVIVADNGSVAHEFSTDTNNDYHRITGLAGVTRIYHLLYAGTAGGYIGDAAAQAIMETFLDAISAPDWVSPDPAAGNIGAGGSQTITLTIDAGELTTGVYHRALLVNSNDPLRPAATFPLALTVVDRGTLVVTGSSGFAANGPRGGPFMTQGGEFTLTNSGGEALAWTAENVPAWLDLDPASGTLEPGESIVVTAITGPAADELPAGIFTASIDFTNVTTGRGNTTRPAELTVALPAPFFEPEPAFTGGTSNTVAWSAVDGAESYQVEISSGDGFETTTASDWLTETQYTFDGLENATSYHFRVRARYESGPDVHHESAWSDPVSSVQDNLAPLIIVATPEIVTGPLVSLSGSTSDLSGIDHLTINGDPAETSDDFINWTIVAPLEPGWNSFEIIATDHAEPANVATVQHESYLIVPGSDDDHDGLPDAWEFLHGLDLFDPTGDSGAAGDFDHDSVVNLMEYALGLDPAAPDVGGVPHAAVEMNPGDGKPYLTFRYRRLLEPGTLAYHVEISTDAVLWNADPANFEEAAPPVPVDGGLTEEVTVRVLPAIDTPGTPARFVRLRVVAN